MRENLHRFFRAARGAGVRVSPAESIDAMRAVANVGFADRGILRDTFLLTLAKTQDEKRALGDCFDLFFSQPEPAQDQRRRTTTDRSGKDRTPTRRSRLARRSRRRRSDRSTRPAGADAAVAGPQRDGGRDRQRLGRGVIVRHPLFHPARHLFRPHPRCHGHPAPARRPRRSDRDQSRAGRAAAGRAR